MKALVRRLLVACLSLLPLAMLAVPQPAWGAPEIGLSNDGRSFSPRLAEPIFDPEIRWVPGDKRTGVFYVRNQGPTRAYLTITARSRDGDRLLTGNDVRLRARVAGGSWVPLVANTASADLTRRSIPRGDVVRVEVEATFTFSSPNPSQLKALKAAFDVTLRQDPDDLGLSPENNLPNTGGPTLNWLLAGSAALGLGLALLRRRRDEPEEAAHVVA